jgi:hypothetical protein
MDKIKKNNCLLYCQIEHLNCIVDRGARAILGFANFPKMSGFC